jgi:hypothetical protein
MPLIYGEGRRKALVRMRKAFQESLQDALLDSGLDLRPKVEGRNQGSAKGGQNGNLELGVSDEKPKSAPQKRVVEG